MNLAHLHWERVLLEKEAAAEIRKLKASHTRLNNRVNKLQAVMEEFGIRTGIMERVHRAERLKGLGRSPSKWGLKHDYLGDWNMRAARYRWPGVKSLTKKRATLLRAREHEESWNWSEILVALDGADHDFLANSRWWNFDFLIGSNRKEEVTYIKLLEGFYRPEKERQLMVLPKVN